MVHELSVLEEQRMFWLKWYGIKKLPGEDGSLTKLDPDPTHHLAGRWAAKEAIIKASTRKLSFSDILIVPRSGIPLGIILDKPGQMASTLSRQLRRKYYQSPALITEEETLGSDVPPDFKRRGPLASSDAENTLKWLKFKDSDEVYREVEGQAVQLSISHDEDYAVAAAIVPNDHGLPTSDDNKDTEESFGSVSPYW